MLLLMLTMLAVDHRECLADQFEPSPLFSVLRTGEYFGETYTERIRGSRPQFVFFVGEPVKMNLVIGNRGPDEQTVHFNRDTAQRMFNVEAWQNDVPVRLRLSFDNGKRHGPYGPPDVFDVREPARLQAREEIRWQVAVEEPLAPGAYRLSIDTNAIDGNSRPIVADSSIYEFVIQPRTPESQPEILRRQALRHYLSGDKGELASAEIALERLLRIHPTSYEAFLIRARIAEARGDTQKATASYDRAADILRNDRDILLLKHKSRGEREQMLAGVEALRAKKP